MGELLPVYRYDETLIDRLLTRSQNLCGSDFHVTRLLAGWGFAPRCYQGVVAVDGSRENRSAVAQFQSARQCMTETARLCVRRTDLPAKALLNFVADELGQLDPDDPISGVLGVDPRIIVVAIRHKSPVLFG
ncbi:hypothetical protein AB0J47_18315 [Nocardia sp. NPDC049737]|uniref:hypothetical protein n=1 Tax=Nocardia sp. NPDC049737 TaxID=3154358 RepID=UPI0034373BF5